MLKSNNLTSFCKNCSIQNTENSKYCSNCGSSLQPSANQFSSPPIHNFTEEILSTTNETLFIKSSYKDGEKFYGLVDVNSNWIINPLYDGIEVFDYKSQYLSVWINGKRGLISSQGKTILPIEYYSIFRVSETNFFLVSNQNDCFGIIDSSNTWIVKPIQCFSLSILNHEKGLYILDTGFNEVYIVNSEGHKIRPEVYEKIIKVKHSRNSIVINLDGLYGVIDDEGVIVTPHLFKEIRAVYNDNMILGDLGSGLREYDFNTNKVNSIRYKEQIYPVKSQQSFDRRHGDQIRFTFINKNGNSIFDDDSMVEEFDSVEEFEDGISSAIYQGEKGYLTISGSWTSSEKSNIPNKYKNFATKITNESLDDNVPIYNEQIVHTNFLVEKDGKCGIMDVSGNFVIPLKSHSIKLYLNQTYEVSSLNSTTYYDYNGNIIYQFQTLNLYWWNFNSSKIYFGNNVSGKKIFSFMKNFLMPSEFTVRCYYDDTLFGRGDDGIAIVTVENQDFLYIRKPNSNGAVFSFNNNGLNSLELIDIEYSNKTISFVYKDQGTGVFHRLDYTIKHQDVAEDFFNLLSKTIHVNSKLLEELKSSI